MTIALVTGQTAHTSDSSPVTTRNVVLPNNPTAGNIVVVLCAFPSGNSITSIKDSVPNTYTAAATLFTANSNSVNIYYLPNVPSGATKTITITTSSVSGDWWAFEFSGVVTSSPLDGTPVTASQPSGSTYSTPSITPTVSGDLLVSVSATNGDINGVNGSWIAGSTLPTTQGMGGEYQILTGSATTATGFTLSTAGTGAGMIAGFKAAAGAATPTFGWSRDSDIDSRARPRILFQMDEAKTWFLPSQVPVPTGFYPPTTGADRERLPPIQRTDWAPQWFVRSPNPVPTIWLPTTGEEDRPPPVKRSPDESVGWFFVSTAARTTPSTVFFSYQDGWIKPVPRPPDEAIPWFYPSQIPVPQIWLPTTGEEDRPPAQKRPPDEPGTFFLQVETSPRTTPSIWWAVGQDGYIKPIQRPPDESLTWFRPSQIPVPTTWLPTTGEEDRPPVQQSDQYRAPYAIRPLVAPVGIAGIAWWRQTEVYLEPPASYRDYHPAWDPQFIVQIVPPKPKAVYNTMLLSIMGGMFSIPGDPPS